MNKRKRFTPQSLLKLIIFIFSGIALVGGGFALNILIKPAEDEEETETTIEINATLELPETIITQQFNDKGEIVDIESYPYVESVDGGQFMEVDNHINLIEGDYADLGSIEYVDTSSVEAFKNSTLGRCIIANNIYGAQCVSLARAFWFDYAGRDVSTCGTGVAKGMMNCYTENAGDDFVTIWNTDDIISGTWIVSDGSWTGHICMALDKPFNGYVTCLGENQGGKSCGEGVLGASTNIVNLSIKNFIGGYIPKSYIPSPKPNPEILPDTSH